MAFSIGIRPTAEGRRTATVMGAVYFRAGKILKTVEAGHEFVLTWVGFEAGSV